MFTKPLGTSTNELQISSGFNTEVLYIYTVYALRAGYSGPLGTSTNG